MPWDWQLDAADGDVRAPDGVKLMDVDGFTTSAATVGRLRGQGIITVCYLNAGSWEPYRPDADQYPQRLLLAADPDWPDERFVDVTDVFRPDSALARILRARIAMCADKGFEVVEPDNLFTDQDAPAGRLSAQDTTDFAAWVADAVHAQGMAVLQKNGPDRVLATDRHGRRLVDLFDGVLAEQCQAYDECSPLAEYTRRGKLVLDAEYEVEPDCSESRRDQLNVMRRDQGLVAPGRKGYLRVSCS